MWNDSDKNIIKNIGQISVLKDVPPIGLKKGQYENKPLNGIMKAANLHDIANLKAEYINIPQCEDDEVLVKVKNCGICGSDINRILKNGTYHFPTIPGHEFSGKVIYDKSGIYVGKRVVVFPLLPCFKCNNCKNEKYAQCSNYNYYGSRCDGAYAEYIAVKKMNLLELPENVTYEEGAMCEPTAVALHAIKLLKINSGENILITGAGTIGLISGMWAKHFGAKNVYYIDIDNQKIDFCKSFGFKQYEENLRIDLVLEGTGASSAIEKSINAVKSSGKIVLMGNPSKDVNLNAKTYQNILRKELKIAGTWNSDFFGIENNWKECLEAISKGQIVIKDLITDRISINEIFDTIKIMATQKKFYCKVMIENEK